MIHFVDPHPPRMSSIIWMVPYLPLQWLRGFRVSPCNINQLWWLDKCVRMILMKIFCHKLKGIFRCFCYQSKGFFILSYIRETKSSNSLLTIYKPTRISCELFMRSAHGSWSGWHTCPMVSKKARLFLIYFKFQNIKQNILWK